MSQRVCLTYDLKNDPAVIEEYKKYHSPEFHWDEINDGIKQSGVTVMDIYLVDNRMFMICEVAEGVDFDEAWAKMGTYPRQSEWVHLMDKFMQAVPGYKTGWVKMEKIFELR